MTGATKALVPVLAYLVGSIPFGVILTRLVAGKDVRSVGSGNIGASNVTRAAGKAAGVLTLVLDAAKAAVPMLVAQRLFAGEGHAAAEAWTVTVGLAAFVGHVFPLWLRFKGGKGVATALGVFLVLAPIPSLLALVAFGVAFALTRVPAVGSLAGTAVCAVGAFVQTFLREGRAGWSSPVPWAGLALALVIAARHRSNLARLRQGSENRV